MEGISGNISGINQLYTNFNINDFYAKPEGNKLIQFATDTLWNKKTSIAINYLEITSLTHSL
jgi:hypothetical protein